MSNLISTYENSKILTFLLTVLMVCFTGISNAEDTEIYFSALEPGETERPNLLFILDSSGSMQSSAGSSGQSRIAALKEAMNSILTDVEGVNVGLMRFNTFDGGPVLFPITYIDAAANTVASEEDDSKQSYNYTITTGTDDAVEVVGNNDDGTATNLPSGVAVGEMDTSVTKAYLVNSPDIPGTPIIAGASSGTYQQTISSTNNDAFEYYGDMYRTSSNLWFYNGGNLHNGMRFTSLNIPVNAKIDSATLRLTTNANYGNTRRADVYAIDADDVPNEFSSADNQLSSASLTSATVEWSVSANTSNSTVDSPNLSSIIQEIVSNGCTTVGDGSTAGCTWSTNNSIVLITKNGTGTKRFYSRDGTSNTSRRPRLTIDWSVAGTVTGSTATQQGINRITGLRFTGVDIPQGATITSAKLKVSSSLDEQNDNTSWTISAENISDSPGFDVTNGNLSARTKTATIPWALNGTDNWQNEDDGNGNLTITTEESPELKTIVQTVVNDANWCGGNAMSFFIQGTDYSDGREIYHFESGSGYEPELFLEYDKASGTGGCIAATNSDEVASSTHDAEENTSNGNMTRFSNDLDLEAGNDVGVFFEEVNIPQGVTITEAYIRFTADEVDTGTSNMTISIEDETDTSAYVASSNDITSRNYWTTTVSWSPEDWDSNNSSYFTSDIKTLVQHIVSKTGWENGNGMGFKIATTGTNRRAKSYDHGDGVSDSPRLIVNYEATAVSSVKTIRERLIEIVNDLPAADATPITETLFEAANYWTGADVQLGKARYHSSGNSVYASDNRISHPGSYCTKDGTTGVVNCGNANIASYPNFGINTPSGCSESNLDDSDCRDRRIEGTNIKYISPFQADTQCAANYQILVTDGEANSLSNGYKTDIRTDYLSGAACDSTRPDGSTVASSESCSLDLVEHMATNDLSTGANGLDDEQTVKTYTIGFDTSSLVNATNFLTNMAEVGEGEFKEADDAASLASVFQEILSDVRDAPTSFATPGFTSSAFNKLETRDEVYFGLFSPDSKRSWKGNLKKFKLCTQSVSVVSSAPANCENVGDLLDANGNKVLSEDGRFIDTSLSLWTDATKLTDDTLTADGIETLQGGAGQQADDYTNRVIYTDLTSSGTQPTLGTDLNTSTYKLTDSTWDSGSMADVRNEVCTTPNTANASTCADVMQWMLGKVINDNISDVDDDSRWIIGDILHSSPTVVTYGGADVDGDNEIDEFYDKVIVASNSGALHFFNASNDSVAGGNEEWAFMPKDSLTQQEAIFNNAEGFHLNVFDLSPVIRQCDGDSDGFIEPAATDGCDANQDGVEDGDYVHVIAGMRRGGKNYYALDITGDNQLTDDADNSIEPKFLWRIEGGVTPGFEDLSYTWSEPVLTTIVVTDSLGVRKDMEVMIFGGGYDTTLDTSFGANGTVSPGDSLNDNDGNIIYIVNPYNGQLIFSVGGSGTNATVKVPDMHHSVPAQISTLDSDADGDTDRLYFSDTGGQIWRIDLANDIKPEGGAGAQGSSIIGRFASISASGGTPAINERRFFQRPALVKVLDKTFSNTPQYVAVVIGTGNRSHPLDEDTEDYMFVFRDYQTTEMTPASIGSNFADNNYPIKSSGTGPVLPTDMIDASNDILDPDSDTVKSSAGYYINFSSITTDTTVRKGEKVLSNARVIDGKLIFSTYSPNRRLSGSTVDADGNCLAQIGASELYILYLLSADGFFSDGVGGRQSGLVTEGITGDVNTINKDGTVSVTTQSVNNSDDDDRTTQILNSNRNRTYWYEY